MGQGNTGHRRYSFGDYVLDVDRGALLAGGSEVRLRPQSFEVLRYLVERHGRLVAKDELQQAIWGHTVVTDGSLTQCLIDVRRALGDHSRQLVRTVPRRGFIFDAPVEEGLDSAMPTAAPPAPGTRAHRPRRRWFVAFGAVIVLAALVTWLGPRFESPDATPPARPSSIAVLPFVDMSQAQDQGYFSDGISEEILNTLAQSPELEVIARTSSFSFKGKGLDIAAIAERLDVAYVLEGSVRRSGNRVRITAQLADASTGAHLWSETYDHDLDDIFAVQSSIAVAVAGALQITLAGAARTGVPTANAEAFELFLQGRFFHTRRAPGDSARAEDYYRRALAIDPAYGRAWAGLAGAYIVQIIDEHDRTEEKLTAWREAVERALRHAPDLAESHVRAAQYYWNAGDVGRAEGHRRRAMALEPENPLVLSSAAGASAFRGRLLEAIAQQRRAVELDPLSAIDHGNLAHLLAAAGRLDDALAEEAVAVDLNPSDQPSFEIHAGAPLLGNRFDEALAVVEKWPPGRDREAGLAMAYHGLGMGAEADAALARLIARDDPKAFLRVAEVHALRGAVEQAFEWLERGRGAGRNNPRAERSQWVHDARLSPFLIPLREDPRWERILAWQEYPNDIPAIEPRQPES